MRAAKAFRNGSFGAVGKLAPDPAAVRLAPATRLHAADTALDAAQLDTAVDAALVAELRHPLALGLGTEPSAAMSRARIVEPGELGAPVDLESSTLVALPSGT